MDSFVYGFSYENYKALEKSSKENESYAGFIQDKWSITPSIVFTGGLRYEYWNIWFANKEESIYYDASEGNADFIEEGGWGRRRLNLDEVIQDGIEVGIEGQLFDPLSFYVSCSYQDWTYHGPDRTPYGEAAESLDDRAK